MKVNVVPGVSPRSPRNPKGGSFVRPANVSFGVDFLTVVRQEYTIDREEVLSQEISISSRKLEWGKVKERRYDTPQTVCAAACLYIIRLEPNI